MNQRVAPRLPHHRPEERDALKARLEGGASILMLAPRRIGKTWLLKQIDIDMTKAGWLCIRIDVESTRTEDEFLRALCEEIERKQDLKKRVLSHFSQRFKQLMLDTSSGLSQAIGKIDPRSFVETLVESLNAEKHKTLILIDEIALFILERVREDPDGTKSLLYHLRKLQQAYENVSWFLTGSVGLDVVARRHGFLGALLGFDTFPLEPFSEAAALSYVEELCTTKQVVQPFQLAEGAFAYLAEQLGWLSPFYLRQIALNVRPGGKLGPGPTLPEASSADIEIALQTMLQPVHRTHFAAWEEHIIKNFEPADKDKLKAILSVASETPDGDIEATFLARLQNSDAAVTVQNLKELLISLANDGYLVKTNNRWKFLSGLLRRYWREYHAL